MMSRIMANDRAGERMDREWIIEAKAGEEGGGGEEGIEGVEHQNKRNGRRSIVTASLY